MDLKEDAKTMAEYPVVVPSIAGQLTIVEPSIWRGAKLLVDGAPAERIRGRYRLKKSDGTTTEAQFRSSFGQYLPTLIVEGASYDVGPKLSKAFLVLAFLPFCLVFIGGALGGLCGAVGWAFNNQLARTSLPATVKVVVMLLVTAVAIVAFLGLATLFRAVVR